MFVSQIEVEAEATLLANAGDEEGAAAVLSQYSATATANVLTRWHELFQDLISRYHDGES